MVGRTFDEQGVCIACKGKNVCPDCLGTKVHPIPEIEACCPSCKKNPGKCFICLGLTKEGLVDEVKTKSLII